MTEEEEKEKKPRFCCLVGNIASALNAKTHPLLLLCAHNKARKGRRISLMLLSFKLNTSFDIEKKKKRREGKGAKKCAYPRRVGGVARLKRKRGGCTHCQQQFSSPLQRGLVVLAQWPVAKEERHQVCLCSLFPLPNPSPPPPPCTLRRRLAGGYHSSSVCFLLHLHWNNKGKGGRGASLSLLFCTQ